MIAIRRAIDALSGLLMALQAPKAMLPAAVLLANTYLPAVHYAND
jgi:hypothetical protein